MYLVEAEIRLRKQGQKAEKLDSLIEHRDDLLRVAAQQYSGPLERWGAKLHFVQGWPVDITIGAASFITYAAEIIATVPVRHLNLTAINERPDVFHLPQTGADRVDQRWRPGLVQQGDRGAHDIFAPRLAALVESEEIESEPRSKSNSLLLRLGYASWPKSTCGTTILATRSMRRRRWLRRNHRCARAGICSPAAVRERTGVQIWPDTLAECLARFR